MFWVCEVSQLRSFDSNKPFSKTSFFKRAVFNNVMGFARCPNSARLTARRGHLNKLVAFFGVALKRPTPIHISVRLTAKALIPRSGGVTFGFLALFVTARQPTLLFNRFAGLQES